MRSVGPFIRRRQLERGIYFHREPYPSTTDKSTRAQSIRGRMSMGKVYFPRRAAWLGDFEAELLRFPVGRDDDQVDALALLGRMLGHMTAATIPPKPEPPRWGRTFEELMEAHDRIVDDGSQSRI